MFVFLDKNGVVINIGFVILVFQEFIYIYVNGCILVVIKFLEIVVFCVVFYKVGQFNIWIVDFLDFDGIEDGYIMVIVMIFGNNILLWCSIEGNQFVDFDVIDDQYFFIFLSGIMLMVIVKLGENIFIVCGMVFEGVIVMEMQVFEFSNGCFEDVECIEFIGFLKVGIINKVGFLVVKFDLLVEDGQVYDMIYIKVCLVIDVVYGMNVIDVGEFEIVIVCVWGIFMFVGMFVLFVIVIDGWMNF